MKLIIVRHGDPDYEHDSLTEKGFREAELLKNYISKIKVDEFYCSPLGRAQRTSEPTLKLLGKSAETLSWLKEFWGYIIDPKTGNQRIPWDLMPAEWTDYEELYHKDNWRENSVIKSGTFLKVYDEVCGELDRFLSDHGYVKENNCYKAVKPNKGTVLFFCHFGIEMILLSRIIGVSPIVLWHNFVCLPTGITTIQTEEREEGVAIFRIRGFGELPHLYEAGEVPSQKASFCELFSDKDGRH